MTITQRIEGCLYLTCPRCKEHWCWSCGEWGGGPSKRPAPHHVFVCIQPPADPTWLDGHTSLLKDSTRVEFYLTKWDERVKDSQSICTTSLLSARPSSAS